MNQPDALAWSSRSERVQLTDEAITKALALGLVHLTAEDAELDGHTIIIKGRRLVNFGSCSYVGLETDQRLKDAAIQAVLRYGVQFASSRVYVSAPLYTEFETLLESIFQAPLVVAQTTSLGHFACLPVLIGQRDAVLYDVLVHASVQAVLPSLRAAGTHCAVVPHNRMWQVEQMVTELERNYEKVWYLCDGVYSMFGDMAPISDLRAMIMRHDKLYLYVDDAHGMSWMGRHGAGSVLGTGTVRTRTVVALSLAKAFSASGAALVFPDAESRRLVKNCGSTMIFSGPLQPALVGAGIAAARIHLSEEIYRRQSLLKERIAYFNRLAGDLDIRLGSTDPTPIRFLLVGADDAAYSLAARLVEAGFYVNVAVFPAVPKHRAGIRIALTTHHTQDNIRNLLEYFAKLVPAKRIG